MSIPAPHDEPAAGAPHVHVVRGTPDEDELAALVAGLVATARPDEEPAPTQAEWTNRGRALPRRPAAAPGPDAWRWSLHP